MYSAPAVTVWAESWENTVSSENPRYQSPMRLSWIPIAPASPLSISFLPILPIRFLRFNTFSHIPEIWNTGRVCRTRPNSLFPAGPHFLVPPISSFLLTSATEAPSHHHRQGRNKTQRKKVAGSMRSPSRGSCRRSAWFPSNSFAVIDGPVVRFPYLRLHRDRFSPRPISRHAAHRLGQRGLAIYSGLLRL
ncbi:hypothetical protein N657DRAFT_379643 [Parathielavia appendiculata]|uniref:Uncharacterized protein n=1 Tax=Parathielavia appendiculata TaxID=2587402 RepID=A0AAN6U0I9_9PEZI|nr:hypothetical protein N657DRAFT_379643 [Parathielavia appendiculata]